MPLVRNLSRILKALAACQSGLRGLKRPGTFKLIEVTAWPMMLRAFRNFRRIVGTDLWTAEAGCLGAVGH